MKNFALQRFGAFLLLLIILIEKETFVTALGTFRYFIAFPLQLLGAFIFAGITATAPDCRYAAGAALQR